MKGDGENQGERKRNKAAAAAAATVAVAFWHSSVEKAWLTHMHLCLERVERIFAL
jgi:hypothetical protein